MDYAHALSIAKRAGLGISGALNGAIVAFDDLSYSGVSFFDAVGTAAALMIGLALVTLVATLAAAIIKPFQSTSTLSSGRLASACGFCSRLRGLVSIPSHCTYWLCVRRQQMFC